MDKKVISIDRLQLIPPSKKETALHSIYGHEGLKMIRGAGEINNPDLMLIFMNPTKRNVSSFPSWQGLRAPWIGTKRVWRMLGSLNLISPNPLNSICSLPAEKWEEEDALRIYKHIKEQGVYITNLASCTQPDARPLANKVFREYIPIIYDEILSVNPKKIISFGNQVSSMLLQKVISVSSYQNKESEVLEIGGKKFEVYPTYYPVGQGQRNMPRAIRRIKLIINKKN